MACCGRIVYDAHEAVMCFLLDEVDRCMDGFREVWENVSKIVVIACEGTSAFSPPMSWVMYLCGSACSREYGQGEAVGGRAAALIRPANHGVQIRVSTYHAIIYCTSRV